jgi:PAS domain S-box-containing protein
MSAIANTSPAGLDSLPETQAGVADNQPSSEVYARQRAALLAFGRRANAKPPLEVLLQDAAAMIATILGTELMGVARVVADGAGLLLRVAPLGTEEQTAAPLSHETPLSGHSSAGLDSMAAYALKIATPVVTPDLAAEQRFADLFLRKLGVHSALCVPLHLNMEPFGAMGVFARRQRVFALDELSFAETMAHLLTSSIAQLKAEDALREARAINSTIATAVDALVMTLDAQGNVVSLNRACQQATGLSIEEVRGRPFCSVFTVPFELGMVEETLRRTINEKTTLQLQSYWPTKDGARRHVRWSARPVCGEDGSVRSIVVSGTDRTEPLEASERSRPVAAAVEQSDQHRGKLSAGVHEEAPASDLPAANCQSTPGEGIPPKNDNRRRARRTYRYPQLIAPIREGALPARTDFFEVVCENISAGGISFYLPAAPDFRDLVVALGKPPLPTYITAQVMWTRERPVDGRAMHQVGCRFNGRVSLGAMRLPSASPANS